MALMDGELSAKEREIILRKAEKLGEDPDEVEMWLEGKLQQRVKELQGANQQKANLSETTTPKKSDKLGDIKKCPSCGAIAQSFATNCSDCGHEFRNLQANSGIQKLFELLNAAENNRTNSTSSMFGKLQSVFGVNDADKNKLEIISSFPIPTTKDDMLEFLSLALPKTKIKKTLGFLEGDDDKVPNMYARTWLQKCEQIIIKARFSMKEEKNVLEEINQYAKILGIK